MKSKNIAEILGRYRELLSDIAEGGPSAVDTNEYRKIRGDLLGESRLKSLIPEFIYEQRSPRDFWNYIQQAFPSYRERSQYIEAQLLPIERQFRPDRQKAPGYRPPEVKIEYLPAPPTVPSGESHIISEQRITELRSISSQKFDLTKLIRFCEELNVVYSERCFLATAMLIRALLDHVPPIFEVQNFAGVANNYRGAQSFKQAMAHLEEVARIIADGYIHIQIRSKEVLPMPEQVNFSQEIDLLLSEIVRILS